MLTHYGGRRPFDPEVTEEMELPPNLIYLEALQKVIPTFWPQNGSILTNLLWKSLLVELPMNIIYGIPSVVVIYFAVQSEMSRRSECKQGLYW